MAHISISGCRDCPVCVDGRRSWISSSTECRDCPPRLRLWTSELDLQISISGAAIFIVFFAVFSMAAVTVQDVEIARSASMDARGQMRSGEQQRQCSRSTATFSIYNGDDDGNGNDNDDSPFLTAMTGSPFAC